MKLIRMKASHDAAAAIVVEQGVSGSSVKVTIPAQEGRTKAQLVTAIAHDSSFPNFVSFGEELFAVVEDDYSASEFDVIGPLEYQPSYSVGNVSVSTKVATPVLAGIAGFIVGRL